MLSLNQVVYVQTLSQFAPCPILSNYVSSPCTAVCKTIQEIIESLQQTEKPPAYHIRKMDHIYQSEPTNYVTHLNVQSLVAHA